MYSKFINSSIIQDDYWPSSTKSNITAHLSMFKLRPKILVICSLHELVLQKYSNQINYKPQLATADIEEWKQSIQEIKPTVIIINTEYFTQEMMQSWRDCLPTKSLFIVRDH